MGLNRSEALHLENFYSGVLFLALFVLPAIGFWKFGLNGVVSFWFAYVVTRPLGAPLADSFAKPVAKGGLGYGTAEVSIVLTALLTMLVAYLSLTRADTRGDGKTGTKPGARGHINATPAAY